MNTIANYYHYLRYTKSVSWSKFLLKKSVPITDFALDKKHNKVYLRSVNHHFFRGDFDFFFEGYRKYCWKFLDNGFKFIFQPNALFVKIADLLIKVETLEELYIINEVFIENVYQFYSASDYVVFDIGMNIGVTSLYFSQFPNIKKIYAFEPFPATFQCAVDNMLLNKTRSSKIEVFNFGLSNIDKTVAMKFDSKNKANVGIKNAAVVHERESLEKIELMEASVVLKSLIKEHSDSATKIIVKMDCEGSEYDIFENLIANKMLRYCHIFMVEWHKMEGHEARLKRMINSFKENNYLVKAIGGFDNEAGMIYCFKDTKPEA